MSLTFVNAQCHCGRNSFKVGFQTSALPICSDLCHCTSCRHSTGQLVINQVRFDGIPLSRTTDGPADFTHLMPYRTSDSATRWFCSTCSAHILWEYTEPNSWCVSVGSLEMSEGIVKLTHHIWVGDTVDGGIANYLRVIEGYELPRYSAGAREKETVPLILPVPISEAKDNQNDILAAHCHCNAVRLSITRPSALSALPSSPYPDLIFPYISTPASKLDNPEDEKWWLRPAGVEKPTHYLAGHCACRSCRLTSGFEIQSWAFVPRKNIFFHSSASQEPVELNLQDDNLRPEALHRYVSNPGRNRESCRRCGATVFWWGSERPDVVDVSVGLIDQSQGGVRAENWLNWHKDRVSFSEDAISKTVIEGLVEGLRQSK
ncbi:Mss4-like protein [Collybia nuda]|uniref:Mss4-like protein n=1 Tax=Collybia nuda TaxID=64659 RepID=A0A9P6CBM0_9AGAR|nr:Mss4-like protein [Collybia nuda]